MRRTELLCALCTMSMAARAEVLSGRITLSQPPSLRTLAVTNDSSICGTQRASAELEVSPDSGLANAVVSLVKPPPGGARPVPLLAEVRQEGCSFVPHVAVIGKGGALKFVNADPIAHQIRLVGAQGASFNAVQTRNVVMSRRFDALGQFPVRCDVHPWMSAWAVVVDHPITRSPTPTGASRSRCRPARTPSGSGTSNSACSTAS